LIRLLRRAGVPLSEIAAFLEDPAPERLERWEEALDLEGMGTTLTAVAVLESPGQTWLAVVNVGDSRAYLFQDDQLSRLTRDHSVVQNLIDGLTAQADDTQLAAVLSSIADPEQAAAELVQLARREFWFLALQPRRPVHLLDHNHLPLKRFITYAIDARSRLLRSLYIQTTSSRPQSTWPTATLLVSPLTAAPQLPTPSPAC
jgi:DNA-binding transcriptional MerR regulator